MDAEFSNNENEPGSVISFLRKTVGSAVLLLAFALLPLMYCRLFQRQVPDFGLVKIPIAALTYLVMAFLLLTPEKLAAVWGAWSKSTRWVIVFMLGATLGQGFFHPGILGSIVVADYFAVGGGGLCGEFDKMGIALGDDFYLGNFSMALAD